MRTINGINFAELTSNEMHFLNGYCPKDEHFTSNEEIDAIVKALNLVEREDMQELRNAVVEYYSDKKAIEYKRNGGHTEKSFAYMTAMMSVTSVIDHVRYGFYNK